MPNLVTFLAVVSEKKSFEEIVDDGRTDGRMDGRTDGLTHDAGQRTTPIAHTGTLCQVS